MLMKLRARMKNQKGFTLIELLVVISIIGVLASVAVPKFMDSSAAARTTKVQSDLMALDSAIQLFGANNGGATPTYNVTDLGPYLNTGALPTAPTGAYKISGTVGTSQTPTYSIVAGVATATFTSGGAKTAGTLSSN